LSLTVPQEVTVSVYREVNDRLALLGNGNWQNWSHFGLVGISINSANPMSLTQNLQYHDTWQVAAGAQYKLTPELMFSAGFAYDSSMVSDSTRTVMAPVGAMYRYGVGTRYQWNEHLATGLSHEFMWEGKLSLSQTKGQLSTTTAGQFTNTLVNFFSINLVYVF
jgi:long-chain fatty acid transport protein